MVKVFKEMDDLAEKTFNQEVKSGTLGMEHPHVLKMLGAGRSEICQDGDAQADVFYIVSDLAVNGESFDYVEATDGLDDRKCRQVFSQILSGV